MKEACLVWQPIPQQFGSNWQVDVMRVEDRQGTLSVAIAAYVEPPYVASAWRIDFANCAVYRKRILHYSKDETITEPGKSAAFWEIAPSRYLQESGLLTAYRSQTFHHYVIGFAIHDVLEILAEGWQCSELPAEWAKPFSDGPFPQW